MDRKVEQGIHKPRKLRGPRVAAATEAGKDQGQVLSQSLSRPCPHLSSRAQREHVSVVSSLCLHELLCRK